MLWQIGGVQRLARSLIGHLASAVAACSMSPALLRRVTRRRITPAHRVMRATTDPIRDSSTEALFLPEAGGPCNAAGILENVDSQQIVGNVQGLPIVTDPNISITSGPGTPSGTQDNIFVFRASDLLLYESGVRAGVLPETRASTLTVLLQTYGYCAQSVVELTGLPAPTF